MSKDRTGRLANKITNLLVAIDGVDAPDGVVKIMQAVHNAMITTGEDEHGNPCLVTNFNAYAALNKSFGQQRRHHPDRFNEVHTWLKQPHIGEAARRVGAYHSWRVWCEAAELLHQGTTATRAFHNGDTDRGADDSVSRSYDIMVYAEYLHKVKHQSIEVANENAIQLLGGSESLERGSLYRPRKDFRTSPYTAAELTNLAFFIELKILEKSDIDFIAPASTDISTT